ncbi:MAG: urease accessory protein UreD [Verrucomicrobiota bacterium]|nr:urease accessory protein UreD [Verrucomicrobiota bacterium]
MSGHLDLVCAPDGRGASYLRHQSFRAPVHISKPHHEGDTLVVNVVNPTAGLLAGDRVRMRVHVESGARLLLTTPSASRVHRTPEGFAAVDQEFSVAPDGWLENWPELLIPQAGARYRQQTAIRVEPGGEMLFWESLAPGRVASGEAFAYERLEWHTDVFSNDQLVARERYHLSRDNGSLDALRRQFPTAYYASCFVISPRLADASACWARIHAFQDGGAWIGCSALANRGWVVKLLAGGSIPLRRKLDAIRHELFAALDRPVPSLRRAGSDARPQNPGRGSHGLPP